MHLAHHLYPLISKDMLRQTRSTIYIQFRSLFSIIGIIYYTNSISIRYKILGFVEIG